MKKLLLVFLLCLGLGGCCTDYAVIQSKRAAYYRKQSGPPYSRRNDPTGINLYGWNKRHLRTVHYLPKRRLTY